MLATSRMWRSTRSMPAVSWRPLQAGAPAGEQRLGRLIPLQATFPRGRLLLVHTLSSRPIRRWPCLIRSGPAAAEPEAVAEVVAAEAVVEAAARAVVAVRAEEAARAAVAVRAEAVARAAAPGAEERAAPEAVAPVLAEGTGCFTIFNTTDLLSGLERIGREQNEFYILGYVPPDSPEGSCHTIKVKLNRGGLKEPRSRSGYCNTRSANVLEGKPLGKQLESHAMGSQPGSIHGVLQAPYFY